MELSLADRRQVEQDDRLRERADELALAISKSRSTKQINELGAKLAAVEAARQDLARGSQLGGLPGIWKGAGPTFALRASGTAGLRLLADAAVLAIVAFAADHGAVRALHFRGAT
jgi:hypothetical protein